MWTITQTRFELLRADLRRFETQANGTLTFESRKYYFDVQFDMSRSGPSSAKTVRWPANTDDSFSRCKMTLDHVEAMLKAFDRGNGEVILEECYEIVTYLNANAEPSFELGHKGRNDFVLEYHTHNTTAVLDAASMSASSWWSVRSKEAQEYTMIDVNYPDDSKQSDHLEKCVDEQWKGCVGAKPNGACSASVHGPEGLCVLVVSAGYMPQLELWFGVSSYTTSALYFFVLFTIGSFIRTFLLTNAPYNLIYKELPEPELLMHLCEGIFIARMQRYQGHLMDEVRLYETLVKLLRSPEMMLRMTTQDVIHLPPDKNKRQGMAKASKKRS
jgi:hypothetical protein